MYIYIYNCSSWARWPALSFFFYWFSEVLVGVAGTRSAGMRSNSPSHKCGALTLPFVVVVVVVVVVVPFPCSIITTV